MTPTRPASPPEPEDWTRQDAIRVLGIAWDRTQYGMEVGQLPSNGTEGDIAFDNAVAMMERTPGLRTVLEAGIRALEDDDLFGRWLVSLYSGGRSECVDSERALAERFPPDPEPTGMTAEEVADAMIADLHARYGKPEPIAPGQLSLDETEVPR